MLLLRSAFFQILCLTLLVLSLTEAASLHQEILKEYDINVAAVYQEKGTHAGSQCATYAADIRDSIGQQFLNAGEAQDDTKRRGLRQHGGGQGQRELINCSTFCIGYDPQECFYWSQGKCDGRRALVSITPEGDYPDEVKDICRRRTHLMKRSLRKAARLASVSKECKNFFYQRWLYKCVVEKK